MAWINLKCFVLQNSVDKNTIMQVAKIVNDGEINFKTAQFPVTEERRVSQCFISLQFYELILLYDLCTCLHGAVNSISEWYNNFTDLKFQSILKTLWSDMFLFLSPNSQL